MKKIISVSLLATAIIFVVSSCDSFLDDQPRGYAIPQTLSHYEGMLNTPTFFTIQCADYTRLISPQILLTSQNVSDMYRVMSAGKPTSAERAFHFEKNVFEPEEECRMWAYMYENIYVFNSITNGVMESEDGSDDDKKAVQAEARVSRAWLHFMLAQAFSKPYNANTPDELTIPLVKEADTYAEEFKRATMKEFYEFVTNEMEEAVPMMKDAPMHRYRAYMTTGLALLGKMYWMMGEYKKALEPLRKTYQRLKEDNSVCFLRNYNKLLADVYGNRELTSKEIYASQSTAPNSLLPHAWADAQIMWVKQNPMFNSSALRYYNAIGYFITPEQYAKYDDYDLRRNLILTHDNLNMPSEYPIGGISDYATNYGVSVPEVYLALAECEAREGDESRARVILEELRSNRILTGYESIPENVKTKDDLIRFCVEEQDREFLASVNNYYNLRRLWNDPLFQDRKPYTHTDGTKTYTMKEDNLYLRLPEGVLKWNEHWRNNSDQL